MDHAEGDAVDELLQCGGPSVAPRRLQTTFIHPALKALVAEPIRYPQYANDVVLDPTGEGNGGMFDINKQELDGLFRKAMRCSACFASGQLARSLIDVAQPRWIGLRSGAAKPRVLIMITNPGAGENRRDDQDLKFRDALYKYSDNKTDIQPVFSQQFGDMQNWNKLLSFYIYGFGLDLQEIALANVAWCGSKGDQHPSWMLNNCFERHTKELPGLLKPELVILGGRDAAGFRARIRGSFSSIQIEAVLHFAHRKGMDEQNKDIARVCDRLAATRRGVAQCP